jgi:hypothetical protein
VIDPFGGLSRSLLRPGERVLWHGRPIPRRFVLRGSPLAIPFTFLWFGFAIFWEVGVLTSRAPGLFALWGLPFIAMGAYISVGRFFVAWREATHTVYAVTDQRILIVGGALSQRIQELSLRTMPAPTLDQGADGVGTITFGPSGPYESWVPPGWPMMRRMSPSFMTIADSSAVFRKIDEAVAQARSQA